MHYLAELYVLSFWIDCKQVCQHTLKGTVNMDGQMLRSILYWLSHLVRNIGSIAVVQICINVQHNTLDFVPSRSKADERSGSILLLLYRERRSAGMIVLYVIYFLQFYCIFPWVRYSIPNSQMIYKGKLIWYLLLSSSWLRKLPTEPSMSTTHLIPLRTNISRILCYVQLWCCCFFETKCFMYDFRVCIRLIVTYII